MRGARAGQTLVVRIDEVVPRPWGATFAPEVRLEWTLAGGTWTCERGACVEAAPFLGVIGMPSAEPLMERALHLDRMRALALASVVADVRVMQIVNGTKGVHAILGERAFR